MAPVRQFWAIFFAQGCAGEYRFLIPNKNIRKSGDTMAQGGKSIHVPARFQLPLLSPKMQGKSRTMGNFQPSNSIISCRQLFLSPYSELNCSFSPHVCSSQLERASKLRETSAKPYSSVGTRRRILAAPPSLLSSAPCIEHHRRLSLFLEDSLW